jgi:hypothetical protein
MRFKDGFRYVAFIAPHQESYVIFSAVAVRGLTSGLVFVFTTFVWAVFCVVCSSGVRV